MRVHTGGSAMDALRKKMTRMEEPLREWPHEDGTVASWAEHTMGEIQSLMNDFKGALQSYGEDIVVLKKAVLQGSSSGPEAPPKVRAP
ncbi:hypothetical protein CK203_103309 [Vitis vinifera]|uniref:Uncharacterized protein n=1 Tax=Vitis vinifera TaxID=29760 RepID=A0A438FHW0_VITVI|nr:hypothetical protein CK203_103309 [Vitis vinifera]